MATSRPNDALTVKKASGTKLPDAFSLFGPSIKALRLNATTLGVLYLLPLLLTYTDRLPWPDRLPTIGIVLLVAAAFFVGFVSFIASVVAELSSARQQKISLLQTIRQGLSRFWPLLGLSIVAILIVCVGLLLFIIPGIFALQRLWLAPYLMIDQKLGIKATIRASFTVGKKHSGAVWGVLGIVMAITILGIIPVVGVVISTALGLAYLCATAIRYLQIKHITS